MPIPKYYRAGGNTLLPPNLYINIMANILTDKLKSMKQQIRLCSCFMVDSGGYQYFSSEEKNKTLYFDPTKPATINDRFINNSVQHLIDVLEELQPDMAFTLDVPLLVRNEAEFYRKFKHNIILTRLTIALRNIRCPSIKLLVPMQVDNAYRLKIFLTALEGINYDGVGIPLRKGYWKEPQNFTEIVEILNILNDFKINRIHFLGESSLFPIALSCYIGRLGFTVSLDSISWFKIALVNEYIDPLTFKNIKKTNDKIPKCDCIFCTSVNPDGISQKDQTTWLCGHNALMIDRLIECMFENAADINSLRNYFIGLRPNQEEHVVLFCEALEKMKITATQEDTENAQR